MISLNIKKARLKANLSQRQLAKIAGISLPTVQKAEKSQNINIIILFKIAKALNVHPCELLNNNHDIQK